MNDNQNDFIASIGVSRQVAIESGLKLRAAREKSGQTVVQLAARIRVREPYLIAMEEGSWEELPPGVNGRGLIRLYAREFAITISEIVNYQDKTGQSNVFVQGSKKSEIKTYKNAENFEKQVGPRKTTTSVPSPRYEKPQNTTTPLKDSKLKTSALGNHIISGSDTDAASEDDAKVIDANSPELAHFLGIGQSTAGDNSPGLRLTPKTIIYENNIPVVNAHTLAQEMFEVAEKNKETQIPKPETPKPEIVTNITAKEEKVVEQIVTKEEPPAPIVTKVEPPPQKPTPQNETVTHPIIEPISEVITAIIPPKVAEKNEKKPVLEFTSDSEVNKQTKKINIKILPVAAAIFILGGVGLWIANINSAPTGQDNFSENKDASLENTAKEQAALDIKPTQAAQAVAELATPTPVSTTTEAVAVSPSPIATIAATAPPIATLAATPPTPTPSPAAVQTAENVAKLTILEKVQLSIKIDGKVFWSGVKDASDMNLTFKKSAEIYVEDGSKVSLSYGEWDNHGPLGWPGRKRRVILNGETYGGNGRGSL